MEFKQYNNLKAVKKEWISIIPEDSIRFYQTYEFAKICYNYRKTSISNIINRNTKCRFIVGYEKKEAICIAPLAVDKKNKIIYILGHGTNAGYLDFIYQSKLSNEQIDEVMDYCRSLFAGYLFDFIFVPIESGLTNKMKIKKVFENFSITINDFDTYFKSLSKSTRQNIRTAYNRLSKDEYSYDFEIFNNNDTELEKYLCLANEIYQKRRVDWGVSNTSSKFQTKKILRRDVVYQTMRKCESARMCVLKINGKISAFFIGYYRNNRIYIPRLAIDMDYKRYSPGILLIIEYLKNEMTKEHSFTFDLGRGDENYKKVLGGNVYKSTELYI